MSRAALIGKAGEVLVAAELMRRGVSVAYPAYDGGIDLLAYREDHFGRVVPIQIKARSGTCYNFQRAWFKVPDIVLVQVWNTAAEASLEFYIFSDIAQVIEALGEHAATASWLDAGVWNSTTPNDAERARMAPHKNQWKRITDQLPE